MKKSSFCSLRLRARVMQSPMTIADAGLIKQSYQKIQKPICDHPEASLSTTTPQTSANESIMRIIAAFTLLGLLGSLLPTSRGGNHLDPNINTTGIPEEIGLCITDDTKNCTGFNRYCLTNTSLSEDEDNRFCGPCVNGSIVDFAAPDDVELPYCILIDDITVENFRAAFGQAIELGEVDIAERLVIILAVAKFISGFNSQIPPPPFELKLNALAALTEEELAARNGAFASTDSEEGIPFFTELNPGRYLQDIPETVDWTEMGAVTSVKNQGSCGCCWAIATAGALEGSAAIDSNFTWLENVSFQQLISCDTQNMGCDGGDVVDALQYSIDNSLGGVTGLQTYPFLDASGTTTEECPEDAQLEPLSVVVPNLALAVSSTSPSDPNERVTAMKQALAQQPLAVLMDATCPTIQSYSKGIITDDGSCSCASVNCIDHAVLMVGYDDTTNPPSFKIKNSWGNDWGENGYFQVAQTVSDSQPYGLFGLLYQGSAGVGAFNSTAAVPSAATTYSQFTTWITVIASGVIVLYSVFA